MNSARVFTAYFGPLAEKHVAITQQAQWSFGQSWPSLVFLPYLAALDGTQRRELGYGVGTAEFLDLVGPHELAHQWWGHAVGDATYRDAWISEGFAEFSAALVMERTLPAKRLADYWEKSRDLILEKPPGILVSIDQAGPDQPRPAPRDAPEPLGLLDPGVPQGRLRAPDAAHADVGPARPALPTPGSWR